MIAPDAIGLDADAVATFADVHAGYARVLSAELFVARRALAERESMAAGEGEPREEGGTGDAFDDGGALDAERGAIEARDVMRVTSLVVAAAYHAFSNPTLSHSEFAEAAATLGEHAVPFAVPVAICAGDGAETSWLWSRARQRTLRSASAPDSGDADAELARMLLDAWLEDADERSHDDDALVVGRLGVPLRAYRRAIAATDDASDEEEVVGAITEFLRRSVEPIALARLDTFHWTRLMCGVLPAEPESIALCRVVMRRVARRQEYLVSRIVGAVRARVEDPLALVPFEVALTLGDEDDTRAGGTSSPIMPLDDGGDVKDMAFMHPVVRTTQDRPLNA